MNVFQKAVAITAATMLGTALVAVGAPAWANPDERPAAPGHPPTGANQSVTINVLSDVQGDLTDFDTVLGAYASLSPADHMVVNGDLVSGGLPAQYEGFFDVLDQHEHPPATYTIGNHEFDGGSDSQANVDRFLSYTQMPRVYHAQQVGGVPLLHIGSLQNPGEWAVDHQSTLGDEQLRWLDEQLDQYPKQQPVLVFGHHPLPGSVSGTVGEGRQDYYDLDYAEADRLLAILGDHPNVVFFSGHTHYNLRRDDWMNRVRTPDGDQHGFLAVNTGGIETEWGPNPGGPNQGEWSGSADHKQGLRVGVDGNRVTLTCLDFRTDEVIREVSVTMRGTYRPIERPDPAWPGSRIRTAVPD